jgi:hypothetical protein
MASGAGVLIMTKGRWVCKICDVAQAEHAVDFSTPSRGGL